MTTQWVSHEEAEAQTQTEDPNKPWHQTDTHHLFCCMGVFFWPGEVAQWVTHLLPSLTVQVEYLGTGCGGRELTPPGHSPRVPQGSALPTPTRNKQMPAVIKHFPTSPLIYFYNKLFLNLHSKRPLLAVRPIMNYIPHITGACTGESLLLPLAGFLI